MINPSSSKVTSSTEDKSVLPAMFSHEEPISMPEDASNIEQDYIDLFTFKRKGHMTKYVYMCRPDLYSSILLEDSFYPFRMECHLLTQKTDEIMPYFSKVEEAIEIGPGSEIPVKAKTLPLLKNLHMHSCLDAYTAMDISPFYAQQACQIVHEYLPNINTKAVQVDFLSNTDVIRRKLGKFMNKKKKLVFGLGQSIISNNTDIDNQKFLKNVVTLLNNNSYLLLGVDTNVNQKTLERAYKTPLFRELLLNTMHYLKESLFLKDFNPEAFDLIYRWNYEKNLVMLYLKPTHPQRVIFNKEIVSIHREDEFYITSSRKFCFDEIECLMNKAGLEIKDIILSGDQKENTFSIIIAQTFLSN